MIRSLAYIGFTSPRVEDWPAFGAEVLGAHVTTSPSGVRLRIDDAAWRVAVHPAESDDVSYIGWDAGPPDALDHAVDRLRKAGVTVTEAEGDLASDRSVDRLAWFNDPFGFRHELISGQHSADTPFVAGRPLRAGFVTGAGGLGHVVLLVPDLDEATAFYVKTMGFGHSDDVDDGVIVRFLHCNQRHHTLAFAAVPGLVGLHHLMLEVGHSDDVGQAYDIANEQGRPIAMTLGRHTNDRMFSFYVRSPSGFEIEYGHGGRLVDPVTHRPEHFDTQSIWGHKPPQPRLAPGILRPA